MKPTTLSSDNSILLIYVFGCAFIWPLAIIFLLFLLAADHSTKWLTIGAPAIIILATLLLIFAGLPVYALAGVILGAIGLVIYVGS